MIAEEIALEQTMRLASLREFPIRREGIEELAETLRRSAHGIEHARGIVERILHRMVRCPVPLEIREFASDTLYEYTPQPTAPAEDCAECFNTGWRSGWYLVTWQRPNRPPNYEAITADQARELRGKPMKTGVQGVYEASRPCGCAHGRQVTANILTQQQREHEEGPKRGKR